ncbi:MAG: hypothetical protein AAFV29_08460 [Myxococcota bacterium]
MKNYIVIFLMLLGLVACEDSTALPPAETCETSAAPPDALQWKRTSAFTQDLMQALELQNDELCNELGTTPCHDVHRFALGSNEPFRKTIYEPPERPSLITPLVMDRVVLSACSERADQDASSSSPVVFSDLDLTADRIDAASPAVQEQVRTLYRRLLGRTATEDELSVVTAMAEQMSSLEFAKTACFAIATTTEFLFF